MNKMIGCLLGLAVAAAACAQTTKTWKGGSGDWHNPNNWTPASVPAESDTVNLNGGTISLSAPVTISGVMNWTAGGLGAGEALTVGSGGVLNITGAAVKELQCALRNAGRINLSGQASVRLYNNAATLVNLASGLVDSQSDDALTHYYGGGVVNNQGTFRKSGGDGETTISTALTFYNSGVVEAQVGTIALTPSGGTCVAEEGSKFTGAGVNLIRGGTLQLNGAVESANLTVSAGTIAGANGTIQGVVKWTGGTIGAGAALTVAPGAVLSVLGNAVKELQGVITNGGTIIINGGGNLRLYNNASRLVNLAGALVDSQTDDAVIHYYGGVFENQGTFRKSGGNGETTITSAVVFENSGVVEAQTGSITFAGGLCVANDGCRFIGQGRNVISGGTWQLNGLVESENVLFASGTITGTEGVLSGTVEWTGGILGGGAVLGVGANGLLRVVGSGTKYLYGVLTNAGTITLTEVATLRFYNSASRLVNLPGALINSQTDDVLDHTYGGVLENQGTFRKSGGSGTTTVTTSVAFNNNGVVEVQTGTLKVGPGSGQGAVTTAAGATFMVVGDYAAGEGSSFGGNGTVRLAAGTFRLDGRIAAANTVLEGAVLGGTNGIIAGIMDWTSGGIAAGAVVSLDANCVLNVLGSATKDLAGTLLNSGLLTLSQTGAVRFAQAQSRLVNLPGAVVESRSDDAFTHHYSGGVFDNQGTFRKSGGTGATTISSGVTFRNAGVVEAQTGTIALTPGGNTCIAEDGCQFLGAGTVSVSAGALQLNGAFESANLAVSGGTITGTDGVLHGLLRWSGGTVGAGAALTVAPGAVLSVLGNAVKDLQGVITNGGTVILNGGGSLRLYSNASRLVNLAEALVDSQTDDTVTHYYDGGVFDNQGTFRKSGGSGTTTINSQVVFQNSGVVEAQTGTISFAGGLCVANDGCRFVGQGRNVINGGTWRLNGAVESENVLFASGTIAGTNGVLSGVVEWTGGNLGAGAVLTVAGNGLLRVVGGAGKDIYGVLTNAGTITLNGGGNLRLYSVASRLVNLAGALVDSQSDDVVYHYYAGGVFENQGTFRKSGGAGTTSIRSQVVFNNSGVVEAQTGTISFDGGCVANGGCQFTGQGQNVINGGALRLNGAVQSVNLVLAAGTITGTEGVLSGVLEWTGGDLGAGSAFTVSGDGLLRVTGATVKYLYGVLTNAGTITLNGGGNLRFYNSASRLVNLPGALVDSQSDDTFQQYYTDGVLENQGNFRKSGGSGTTTVADGVIFRNSGAVEAQTGTIALGGARFSGNAGKLSFGLRGPADFGRIAFSGTVSLGGTVEARLAGGYEPEVGATFAVLSCGARNGVFASQDLPSAYFWDVTYQPTAVRLVVTGKVLPPEITAQPQSRTVMTGQAVEFTVEASGAGPLRYQWKFNGFALEGQAGPTLRLEAARAADAGSYAVVVSNDAGSTPSAAATLTVVRFGLSAQVRPDGMMALQFPTVAGERYQVETSTDLTAGSWQPVGEVILGDGNPYTFTDGASDPHRFYRVTQLP